MQRWGDHGRGFFANADVGSMGLAAAAGQAARAAIEQNFG
jgi:hypothetical protein